MTDTNSYSAFIPEIWSAKLNTMLEKECVMLQCVNRNYEGEIKNTVSLITMESNPAEDLEDLEDATIGYLRTIDNYGTEQFLKDAKKQWNQEEKTAMVSKSVFDVYAAEEDQKECKYKSFADIMEYIEKSEIHNDLDCIFRNSRELFKNNVEKVVRDENGEVIDIVNGSITEDLQFVETKKERLVIKENPLLSDDIWLERKE